MVTHTTWVKQNRSSSYFHQWIIFESCLRQNKIIKNELDLRTFDFNNKNKKINKRFHFWPVNHFAENTLKSNIKNRLTY